ncbi:MAG: VIT domain-containing protein, partial [Chloroflexi bacterium]|nr:VIT domain-containing protein [Chloroflexota bacterium]
MQEHELAGLVTEEAAPVPLVGVKVTGTITGRSARVKVGQRFENREDKAIEAVYKFPLPEGGSVCGFTVATGDRVLRGQVEEREKAFKLYDDALIRGDGAYLLDEERPNIFTLSVGNVNARNTVDVEVEYVSLLETNGAEVRFFLPTTISPRYVPPDMPDQDGIPVDVLVNPKFQLDVPYGLNLQLEVLGKEDIALLECPSHSIRTEYSDHAIAVELSSNAVAMDRDFILNIKTRKGFESKGVTLSDGVHAYVQVDFVPQIGG